jgi:hypothetical protein
METAGKVQECLDHEAYCKKHAACDGRHRKGCIYGMRPLLARAFQLLA